MRVYMYIRLDTEINIKKTKKKKCYLLWHFFQDSLACFCIFTIATNTHVHIFKKKKNEVQCVSVVMLSLSLFVASLFEDLFSISQGTTGLNNNNQPQRERTYCLQKKKNQMLGSWMNQLDQKDLACTRVKRSFTQVQVTPHTHIHKPIPFQKKCVSVLPYVVLVSPLVCLCVSVHVHF